MKIYNKTNQIQELRVFDRNTKIQYSVYICAKSSTELECNISTPDLPRLVEAGILEILGGSPITDSPKVPETSEEISETEDSVEETLEISEDGDVIETEESSEVVEEISETEDGVNEEPKQSEKFICDICGGEFGSARGLSNHKKKAHKN